MNESPLIIIGMHRSGTSLVARILHKYGVFMGARIDGHNEALFFKAKNQYLYNLAHAKWDNPEPMKYLISNQKLRLELTALLKEEFTSLNALMNYWGLARPWKFRSPRQPNQLWGWKDPRNSYTLPFWLDVFPKAKVLHIYRNGVDVANSLKNREKRRKNKLYNPLLSCRCLELKGAFDVWTEYVDTCLKATNSLPADQTIQIKYENFLRNFEFNIKKIVEFLKIEWNETTITEAAKEIRTTRAYAFLHTPELRQFYENVSKHPLMTALGYDKLKIDP